MGHSESIRQQWDNLLAGKEIDHLHLRPEILSSWQQCLAQNINPYRAVVLHSNADAILTRAAELIAAAMPFMNMINEIITGSGLRIDCIDKSGCFLCGCGDRQLMEESAANGMVSGCDVSLPTLGTNAAGLCLQLKKPVQVFGPEHYNINLHNLNCSATPIFYPGGELAGALNILSYAAPQNRQTLGLTSSIALAIENQLALNNTLLSLQNANAKLKTTMEYLPQGVITLTPKGEIDLYNSKALSMLAISCKTNTGNRTKKLEGMIASITRQKNGKCKKEQECAIEVNNKLHAFVVNTGNLGSEGDRIVLIEDSRRIMSLSAAQSGRTSYTFKDISGKCAPLQHARKLAATVAPTDSNVLLIGESGTGKELFAQAMHAASKRADSPFVAINCGAIPADIIESELFGYEPGAFTGARETGKTGRIETASGGTLFLDEIEAMPLSFQVKLLRTFSSQSLNRVGGNEEIPIDLRIISASKVDLLREVEQGRFREDLYYRIATFPLYIPPLRERGDDLQLLTRKFLKQLCVGYSRKTLEVDKTFLEALACHEWRGNVRELRNILERAVVLATNDTTLTLSHLPESMKRQWLTANITKQTRNTLQPADGYSVSPLKLAEENVIRVILQEERGNISHAARRLGIARSTLQQKIRRNQKLATVANSYS